MSEAKEKDRILAEIKARKHHGEIAGLEKHIDALKADGYVSGSFATDGSIITLRITPQGKRFLENGGYTKLQKAERRRRLSRKAENALYFILGAATTAIVERLVGLLIE